MGVMKIVVWSKSNAFFQTLKEANRVTDGLLGKDAAGNWWSLGKNAAGNW